ncbi:hypothetical protein [Dactylosporangium fulvum]|uniref:Uncharacterized protein n=1 Tax=Dactylosporangium fulvum TaxID=53359 RepID=A0ABY5VQ05_9ACTN|nr:hypothetical protein [Dactylosporangium fulvum]UWP79242.1 hypothetical protein Dfulv_29215 [Dactylosporangium fulvum]
MGVHAAGHGGAADPGGGGGLARPLGERAVLEVQQGRPVPVNITA